MNAFYCSLKIKMYTLHDKSVFLPRTVQWEAITLMAVIWQRVTPPFPRPGPWVRSCSWWSDTLSGVPRVSKIPRISCRKICTRNLISAKPEIWRSKSPATGARDSSRLPRAAAAARGRPGPAARPRAPRAAARLRRRVGGGGGEAERRKGRSESGTAVALRDGGSGRRDLPAASEPFAASLAALEASARQGRRRHGRRCSQGRCPPTAAVSRAEGMGIIRTESGWEMPPRSSRAIERQTFTSSSVHGWPHEKAEGIGAF